MHNAGLYVVLFLGVLISGASVFLIKKENKTLQKLLLAFSGAFLMGISFTHLLPEIYFGAADISGHEHHCDDHGHPFSQIGIFILLGFLIQLFLDTLTRGVEHGHIHTEEYASSPIGLMIGLCLHAFLEGMPIVDSFAHVRNSLTFGVVIHNIPISIVLVNLFLQAGFNRRKSFLLLLLFACMTPLGSIVSNLISISNADGMAVFARMVMGVVIGIFLHVSTSILFEAGESHAYNRKKLISVLLGMGLAVILPL